jgi:hypothetical protein
MCTLNTWRRKSIYIVYKVSIRTSQEEQCASIRKTNQLIMYGETIIVCCWNVDKLLWFLGAFAKLRKATINFVISVCLSVRIEQFGSHWNGLCEFLVYKTNRCTEFKFYWYYDYTLRAAFLPIIRISLPYIGFGTFYAVVMDRLLPGVGWNSAILLLVANGHHNRIKCTKADVV